MESNIENIVETAPKQERHEDNWEEYGSDNDNDENEISHNKEETKIVEKVEKKTLIKDKHGEIIITKLETYVEPSKIVKEARGDVRLQNNYNFGDVSYDESVEENEEDEEGEEVEEVVEEEEKKKKTKNVKKNNEDLDELLKEFGIEAKVENKQPQKINKPKKIKENTQIISEENKKEGETVNEEKKEEANADKKPKKKKATADKSKKASHISELKREILERKEALKKKEKKKGI